MSAATGGAAATPANKRILAIETATLQAGVALVDGTGRVVSSRRAHVTTHSEQLLTLVAEVLDEAGVRPAELSAITCGAGPGSFTGLRIGLATAKGLCLATGAPLVLVSSLAAMALRAPVGVVAVPCIDAFKGEVYAGFYLRHADDAEPLCAIEAEAVLAPERLAVWLRERALAAPDVAVHLVGGGALRWPVLDGLGAEGVVVATDREAPDPVDVGRLAALRFGRGERDDLAAAVPAYIRASEAEIKGPPRMTPSRDEVL